MDIQPFFSTLPAGNKSFDPITVKTERTVVAFYKFLKKHAAIAFKPQKSAEPQKSKDSQDTDTQKSSGQDVNDEF